MTHCRHHTPKRREYPAHDEVQYFDFECGLCGHRSVDTIGDEARVDPRTYHLFAGWRLRMVHQIAFDPRTGKPHGCSRAGMIFPRQG